MKTTFSKKIKEASFGCLTSTVDYALFLIMCGAGMAFSGTRSLGGIEHAMEWAEGVNVNALRRAFRQLREKGYIKSNLSPTREGQERLKTLFPSPRAYPVRWDSTWYLVSFDVPERWAYKRQTLRTALRMLGFGKLHESLWISPFKLLGDVRAYIKAEHINEYVMLAISKELGTERSQALAARVFKLEELNQGYGALLAEIRNTGIAQEKCFLVFRYFDLLAQDPFLPRPLLPENWCGDGAHTWFRERGRYWWH